MAKLVDLTMALHHRTERAALVSDTGEEARAVWLPLSLIEIEPAGRTVRGARKSGQVIELAMVDVTLPERLAIEKGLV